MRRLKKNKATFISLLRQNYIFLKYKKKRQYKIHIILEYYFFYTILFETKIKTQFQNSRYKIPFHHGTIERD